jgi:hypothetical protein
LFVSRLLRVSIVAFAATGSFLTLTPRAWAQG